MTNQQKKWADLVINGKTYLEAYSLAYPKASKKTANNQTSVFRNDSGLMGYIDKGLAKIAQIIETKLTDKLSNELAVNVLTSAKKREILHLIASGEISYEKHIMVKGELKKVLAKPDLHERIKAIDIDNRMTGDNYRAKPAELIPEDKSLELDIFNNVTFVFKSDAEK